MECPNNNNNNNSNNKKKRKSPSDDLICPITLELPMDPVTAEDGRIYERAAIEYHFDCCSTGNAKSPMTNQPIGRQLLPAVQHRNLIEFLVENGDVEEGLATAWKAKDQERKEVNDLIQKAEKGDGDAAYELAILYHFGDKGLTSDKIQVKYWYKKASDAGHVKGMALTALNLSLEDENKVDVIALMSMAAYGGSDLACCELGEWYAGGSYGLTKNVCLAKKLFQKVVNGSCRYKHGGHYDEMARVGLSKL